MSRDVVRLFGQMVILYCKNNLFEKHSFDCAKSCPKKIQTISVRLRTVICHSVPSLVTAILLVILLTVCHTVLVMLVWSIWYWIH